MDLATLRIGFIGAGRLGQSLAWQCARRGLRVTAAASRAPEGAAALVARIPRCEVLTAQQMADICDLVFVTTPDAAIRATADEVRWRAGSHVVHCSGVIEVDALAKAAREGAHSGGFHPLQTFGDAQAAAQSLPGCTGGRLQLAVHQRPAARGRAHVAVLGRQRGGGRAGAAAAGTRHPGVDRAGGRCRRHAGPVSRDDVGSVKKHLAAIAHFDPDALPLYRELCGRTVAIAQAQGRIDPDPDTVQRLRQALAPRPQP